MGCAAPNGICIDDEVLCENCCMYFEPAEKPQPSDLISLLGCPFCGSPAQSDNGFLPCESLTYVWCSNDECYLSPIGRDERLFDPEWWNTRAT